MNARASHGRRLVARRAPGVAALVALFCSLVCPLASGQASSASGDGSDMPLLVAGKATTRAKADKGLAPPLREALDEWSAVAQSLDLRVAVGKRPEHLVLGSLPDKALGEATQWLDQAFDILDPVVPRCGERQVKAVVAIIVEQDFAASDRLGTLMATIASKRLITEAAAAHLTEDFGGLTLRSAPLLLQPSWDIAGNAAAGDDEFRMGNELVNKYAQCQLTCRSGQQPPSILWGLGYVVELRMFGSAYHFERAGFVSTESHFDWASRAIEKLGDEDVSLAKLAMHDSSAGQPDTPQILTWATLSYLAQNQPERLTELLTGLSALQDEADPRRSAMGYIGDEKGTRERLEATLATIDAAALSKWLKKTAAKQKSRS